MISLSPSPAPDERDLFAGDLASWRADPAQAFDHWMASRGFGQRTAVVYRAMWGKWLRWAAGRGLAPLAWSSAEIAAFLDAQDLHKRHRYRYARLIERVFHHLALLQSGLHNPGSQAVRSHLAEGENDPTAFLLPAERDALIGKLLAPAAAPTGPDGDEPPRKLSPTAWKRARDVALLAVLLGAGLKVGEVRTLRLDQLAADGGEIAMTRPENGRTYRVPVFSFARAPLLAWLAVRQAGGTLGQLVFPAQPGGRPLHAVSLYRRVERLLEEAGVLQSRTERASPQTLRNSYAALHFENGEPPAEVAAYLGLRDVESGWRLHAAHAAWLARSGLLAAGQLPPDLASPGAGRR
ncbi:tyrosine-type recombinase/integrase [Cupriavidus sp. AU9028]|uniref:tyrosine-type recombinase/integrase n=1 Tax=Cupriavidus sp. AU9028 TaxID=2871157 RepID=UPI001C971786|nr:tyrosine-type recombinase/integrase [Cupriavidus sp. AU9028]MBY4898415.1 site-specific integrase [Cupriavidus sp. AU9028]